MSTAVGTMSRHGTVSRYNNQGCRCGRCCAARREYDRSLRRVREAVRDASIATVGTYVVADITHGCGGYNNHKCRCDTCVNAWREYCRNYRKRRSSAGAQ